MLNRKTIALFAAMLPAALAPLASAGFVGWTGSMYTLNGNLYLDVFAGMTATTDRLLNVYNANISATGASFYQAPGMGTRSWAPGFETLTAIDSFMTLGGYADSSDYYAASGTAGDPNFTGFASATGTTVPANAGWYNTNPTTSEGLAQNLDYLGATTRIGANAQYGVWVAHFVFNDASAGSSVSFAASAGFKTASTTGTQMATTTQVFAIPTPGAIVAFVALGCRSRRRYA